MRGVDEDRELRERKINSILSGLQNVCCCLLIPFKAISSDVSVTQSANGHDNRDVLKLPHGISLCCNGLNLKNTKEMELVAKPPMNPIYCLYGRTVFVSARGLFVLSVNVSGSQLRTVTTITCPDNRKLVFV